MQSVKAGRGPSLMSGVGGIFMAVFGLIWTIFALSAGAPPVFTAFGVVFILVSIVSAAFSFYNATARNRMSVLDITASGEEPDPIAKALGHAEEPEPAKGAGAGAPPDPSGSAQAAAGPRRYPGEFCPFCGAKVGPDFDYCPKCGKDI